MPRLMVTVRNTFLAFEGGEDEQLPCENELPLSSAFARSKSVGDEPADLREDGLEEDDSRLGHLNRLLRKDPASPGHLIAPLAAPPGDDAEVFGSWSPGRLAAPPFASPCDDAEVQELRQLQRRLREVTLTRAPPVEAPGGLPKATSNASVSTMVPEDTDAARGGAHRPSLPNAGSSNSISSMGGGALRPSLPNVGSSNSISSMVSDWRPSLRNVGSPSSVSEAAPRWEDGPGESPAARPCAEPRRGRGRQSPHGPPTPRDYCHGQVPKRCDLAGEFALSAQGEPPTTLMIRNIPNHYTQSSMVRELEGLGFQDSYNFLYVPLDKGTMGSVGYCFVNFVSPDWASRCVQVFEGRPFERQRRDRRSKVAVVSVAHLQGLEANLRHYRNAAVTGTGSQGKCNGPIVIANLARSLG